MSASARPHSSSRIENRIGVAALTRAVMQNLDLSPVFAELETAANNGPARGAALMDLSTIEQLKGNLERGLQYQSLALQQCQIYETYSDVDPTLDLLVLAAPIHMGGNTPIDFLVANSSVRQRTVFLSEEFELPDQLPEHDVCFVAAPGDCDENRQHLEYINDCLADLDRPILNAPERIKQLERDELVKTTAGVPGLCLPETYRVPRTDLIRHGETGTWSLAAFANLGTPFIIRPVGSHAGRNLELLSSFDEISSYLQRCSDDAFFISSFIDYRSDDKQFRKYRVIFVNGEPFPCHMAISEQWKIWYLNADMHLSHEKRMEERDFMVNFDNGFRARHEQALMDLPKRVGLEYFGIDCAESRDGKLVVFEADNALIVHDMDPPDLFPYKRDQMHRLFAAFTEMLYETGDGSPQQPDHGLQAFGAISQTIPS